VKNVLVHEKYSLDNSTLIDNASVRDFDISLLIGVLIVLIFILIRFLTKEKPKEEKHPYVYADKYKMEIKWSNEDNAYIVTVPELPGCKTHGSTYKEAVKRGIEAIDSWIEASQKWNDPVPPPLTELTHV
jgi:predicted RNase H-like HicB family nuclease